MNKYIFLAALFIGIFFRFYNLNWGSPFFFHPDERNIVYSISQLHFPYQMNPHFFAYGSFPIYIVYFLGAVLNRSLTVSFTSSILLLRTTSAILSILVPVTLFFVGKNIWNKQVGKVAFFLSLFSTGFIQYAHFGTFEMWLAFFSLLLFYFLLKFVKNKKQKYLIFSAVTFGLLLSIKVSSLILFPFFILILLIAKTNWKKNLFVFVVIAFVACILTSPFYILDYSSFISSMQYESSVATGTLPVFYTGQFFKTTPILFQFIKVYPFLLNPLLTILFIPSLIYITYISVKYKIVSYFLLFTIYYLLFIPQAFLFAKWTRYMVPTLPFMYLILAAAFSDFLKKTYKNKCYYCTNIVLTTLVIVTCILFPISYFITVHLNSDSRIRAGIWASEHIPKDARIISEVYDLGIIPFNQYFSRIELFNFYNLDAPNRNISEVNELELKMKHSDYIILPSQRVMKNRLTNKKTFTAGYEFYKRLFYGKLGFTKVYETPCDIFCKIIYMGSPVFNVEETVTVFDRPTVFVFKKNESSL